MTDKPYWSETEKKIKRFEEPCCLAQFRADKAQHEKEMLNSNVLLIETLATKDVEIAELRKKIEELEKKELIIKTRHGTLHIPRRNKGVV
jgi:hypothetical protein